MAIRGTRLRNGSSVAEALWPAGAGDFAQQRIAGLYSRHIGQVATVLTPELEARILENTRRAPRASTHWTTRKLAAHLQVSHMMVARVWAKHGLKPHRIE